LIVDRKDNQIICTSFAKGRRHDFRLFKESKIRVHPNIKIQSDTGYQGLLKLHSNSELPKKRSRKNPLTKEDKNRNRQISSERVAIEHVIGYVKRFKVISERYRNRRKRFALRFNLIAGICNYEVRC